METFSASLALCAGNSPVAGEFPSQRPVTRSFDVFFHLRLNKRLGKQSWDGWLETPPCSLWRHCNEFSSDLLSELSSTNVGVRIEDKLFNSFACADDINLVCLTTVDLHVLNNIYLVYSRRWRFNFGINKTNSMVSYKNSTLNVRHRILKVA